MIKSWITERNDALNDGLDINSGSNVDTLIYIYYIVLSLMSPVKQAMEVLSRDTVNKLRG